MLRHLRSFDILHDRYFFISMFFPSASIFFDIFFFRCFHSKSFKLFCKDKLVLFLCVRVNEQRKETHSNKNSGDDVVASFLI